jgi:Ca2+-binding EF-hand superfamily protein
MMDKRCWAVIALAMLAIITQGALAAPITFENVDGNSDGKITSDEMYVFVQQKAFSHLDSNGDWMITKKEWNASEPKGRSRVAQFSDLDTNQDGQITAIEFAGSFSKRQVLDNLFVTLDRNGDKVLEKAELVDSTTSGEVKK